MIGHCEKELQVHNFVFAALHGIQLVDDHGALCGTLINPGADACATSLSIDAADGAELINTELTLFGNGTRLTCDVTEKFSGKVSMFNSLSWGIAGPTAVFSGKGDVLVQQWNSVQGPMQANAGRVRLENLNFQNAMNQNVGTSAALDRLDLIGNTGEGMFTFGSGPHVVARVNSLPWGQSAGGRFRSGFEKDSPQPNHADDTETVAKVEGRYCRIEKNAGRDNGAALVIAGEDKAPKPSYIYYRVFDANIPIANNSFMRYWIKPSNELSRHSGVDLYFTDGTTLRDSSARDLAGNPLHPAVARGIAGAWTKIESPIGQWLAGKVIRLIVVAYDGGEDTGSFRTAFDDIEIGVPDFSKPIKLQAAPDGSGLKAPLTVKLAADGKCDIRYTLDGAMPSSSSSLYTNAIVLDKADLYEIRCIGVDESKHLVAPVESFLFDVHQ